MLASENFLADDGRCDDRKSAEAIESLLSLDNTILESIEDDCTDAEMLLASHQVTGQEGTTKDAEQSSKVTKYPGSRSCQTDEFDVKWHDETAFNEAFALFNETWNHADNTQQYDKTKSRGNTRVKSSPGWPNRAGVCTRRSDNRPSRRSLDCNDSSTNKKYRLELSDVNFCESGEIEKDFYGLSENTMRLLLKTKRIEKLYTWQEECLKLDAVQRRKNLVYALPTSGGKTLVAEILMLKELLNRKKNVIFIVPFVALVQEKVQSMAPFALEFGFIIEEYAAAKGGYPPRKRRKKNSAYICTIEKALGLINSLIEAKRLQEVGMIVVDELHLLGENGGRGATLEGLLTKVLYVEKNIHIVGMSATIGNLEDVAKFLDAELYTGNFRPVEIKEYVKCGDDICLLNPRTEDLLTDLKRIEDTYSRSSARLDPDRIGHLVAEVIPDDSCLIFCSNRKNCENIALLLSKVLPKSLLDYKKPEKKHLLDALRVEEGLCPTLNKTIKYGVAYHHSGLTSEERRLLEDAFRRGVLCVICCTSTLAAGVNLPARRVILRSPYIGSQFLSLSRYKQMIGRAGRAGLGNIGESILICKSNELPKVKLLLRSKMDDSLSTLHTEKDRGINSLILSAILLSIAATRLDVHKILERTLLAIQQDRLRVNLKKIVDDALTTFLKSGVMKVKSSQQNTGRKSSAVTVAIPSQGIEPGQTPNNSSTRTVRTILLTSKTELELCDSGRAALKGCIDLHSANILYQDLRQAQKHLILLDHLHLLYLVTPYEASSQVKPIGSVYHDVVINLSETEMETARLLGINEAIVSKLRCGVAPKNVDGRVIQRFYVTLILNDLWKHYTVYYVAEKYQINRGVVQGILTSVSTFASSVVRFCEELDEFWTLRDILSAFSKKLSYCCPAELEMLMELPLVKLGRARQLHKHGYTTIQSIAKADPIDLEQKIPYLGKKAVTQIIQAAKLKIMEKVENLWDDAEDVRDGIDVKSAFT